jgi:hypothetical protein
VKADAEAEPRKTVTEERVDGLLGSLSERRRKGIRKSLERPLRIEVLRTGYIGGCILIDIVGLPITLVSVFGRIGLVAALGLLLPLGYLEYEIHNAWFVRDWSAASEDRKTD